MKKLFSFLLLTMIALQISAQKITVSGKVMDGELNEPMATASVVLLKTDSTMVTGANSDLNGNFRLPGVKSGNYILKVSFVGYLTEYKNLKLTKNQPNYPAGTITLKTDAIVLKGAEVTARVAKVEMKEDTFV